MPGGLLNLVAYGNMNFILNGNPSKTFFKSGELMSEELYYKGKKNGLCKRFYKEGILAFEDTYVDGVRVTRKVYNKTNLK